VSSHSRADNDQIIIKLAHISLTLLGLHSLILGLGGMRGKRRGDLPLGIERSIPIAQLNQKSWYKFLNSNFRYRIFSNKVGTLLEGNRDRSCGQAIDRGKSFSIVPRGFFSRSPLSQLGKIPIVLSHVNKSDISLKILYFYQILDLNRIIIGSKLT
jgi:hypothetical protein